MAAKLGMGVGESAEFRDQPRVPALVEHADDQEERPRREPVVDLLNHAAGQSVRRQGKNAERCRIPGG